MSYKIRIQALLNGDIPFDRPVVLETEFLTANEVREAIEFLKAQWEARMGHPYSVLLLYPDSIEGQTYFNRTEAATPAEAVAKVKAMAGKIAGEEPNKFHCLAVMAGHVEVIGDDFLGGY